MLLLDENMLLFDEKRKDFRHPENASVLYRINLLGHQYRGKKVDHSGLGISFLSAINLKPGTLIYIRSEACPSNCPGGQACKDCRMEAFATVKWCRKREGDEKNLYYVGARYFEYGVGY